MTQGKKVPHIFAYCKFVRHTVSVWINKLKCEAEIMNLMHRCADGITVENDITHAFVNIKSLRWGMMEHRILCYLVW